MEVYGKDLMSWEKEGIKIIFPYLDSIIYSSIRKIVVYPKHIEFSLVNRIV